jgi:hypothetical protein
MGCDQIARDDGFSDFAEMKAFFQETHGLPFLGVLIKWEFKKPSAQGIGENDGQ